MMMEAGNQTTHCLQAVEIGEASSAMPETKAREPRVFIHKVRRR
jgi:hypothetical protein